jgi:hypothetical protein
MACFFARSLGANLACDDNVFLDASLQALVECYYVVEDYARLDKLIDALPDASPLLSNIGYKLQSVGLTEGAARALLKAGDVKGAVDSCVLLNLWDKAVELAQQHSLPQIEGLLAKYAQVRGLCVCIGEQRASCC